VLSLSCNRRDCCATDGCALAPSLTVFWAKLVMPFSREISKIHPSMPIAAETEQIADRRNSPLKSRAQISDGSPRWFFVAHKKNLHCKIKALLSLKTIEWE
jgi:hypothetical protein